MKKVFIVLLVCVITLLAGCSEGINVNGQKQIHFSFTQKGENENWKVTDEVSGVYFNKEKLIQGQHVLKIVPTKNSELEKVTVSIKVGDERLKLNQKRSFVVEQSENGEFILKQDGFTRFDNNKKFFDEKTTLIIQYGDQKEKMELQ